MSASQKIICTGTQRSHGLISPTSLWTHVCTDAFTPGWILGPRSTWAVTWLLTATSGSWEMDKKACWPAPPLAALRCSIISTLTSTGWSTKHRNTCVSANWLLTSPHNKLPRMNSQSCRYWIQLPKFLWGFFNPWSTWDLSFLFFAPVAGICLSSLCCKLCSRCNMEPFFFFQNLLSVYLSGWQQFVMLKANFYMKWLYRGKTLRASVSMVQFSVKVFLTKTQQLNSEKCLIRSNLSFYRR